MATKTQDFPQYEKRLRQWVHQHTGVAWTPERCATFPMRTRQALTQLGLDSVELLTRKLDEGLTPAERGLLIDIFTNHETRFFRDLPQFTALKNDLLPALIRNNHANRKLNIWCAGCSTGQEPYSLAMLLDTHFPELQDCRVNLIATDVSPGVLETAHRGLYPQLEVSRGLPTRMLLRYFEQSSGKWQLKDSIRKRVVFREHSLLSHSGPGFPVLFDLVMIRNVLIYFTQPQRDEILIRIAQRVAPGGYLLLGTAETVKATCFRAVQLDNTTVYQKTSTESKV